MADTTTTRAYTLKLSGEGEWRKSLWQTHVAVNRAAQGWGDWLLTLRGGLSPALAKDEPARRVLLALSWLTVEGPVSLTPERFRVTETSDAPADRRSKVLERFREILDRLQIPRAEQGEWITAGEPALEARIRDDCVWIDRSLSFARLRSAYTGLTTDWATETLFNFLGGEEAYFAMPDTEMSAPTEDKDFVQKAGNWLSRTWGSGQKSDSRSIGTSLQLLANIPPTEMIGRSPRGALGSLLSALGHAPADEEALTVVFKRLKQLVGWKGRSSKGALALEKVRDCAALSADLWNQVVDKLRLEASEQSARAVVSAVRPHWMESWQRAFERQLGMPYRTSRDLIWEHGVALDHALRRLSAAHTWIKRAEAERLKFKADAEKITDAVKIPPAARDWLDRFCLERGSESGAEDNYFIRKRAIDGWDKVVAAWDNLGQPSTRAQRVAAARDVQRNLDDDEKFGDIRLFSGVGDVDAPDPVGCLADDEAFCVWHANAQSNARILVDYVAARVAERDQRRFKVPAYRHPDPLRHPIYVDYGNSRWGIEFSLLKTAQQARKLRDRLANASSAKARAKLQQTMDAPRDLHGANLEVWDGADIHRLPIRWAGRRFDKDLCVDQFGLAPTGDPVTRADRLGRIAAGQTPDASVPVAAVFDQKDWNGRLQVPRKQLDLLADLVYGKLDRKGCDPDYAKLGKIFDVPRARKQWEHLRWFLTTSAKLEPRGPWLDYVRAGLPSGMEYRRGKNGWYLQHAVNQGRKSRARLLLSRLPGLRILSLDLGHRYAAACAVWETLSRERMLAACQSAGHAPPTGDELFLHLAQPTNKIQASGRKKGDRVSKTIIYRRIGPDRLPDGSEHPAPWARLDRQFTIRLQGEDRPPRWSTEQELSTVNSLRLFLGMRPLGGKWRINELCSDALHCARLGLRRLGDTARIAFALTAESKPISGGRSVPLSRDERIAYLEDMLLKWQTMAQANRFRGDDWAKRQWQTWITSAFDGLLPAEIPDEMNHASRRKIEDATRPALRLVAQWLVDHPANAQTIQKLWKEHWEAKQAEWQSQLRGLRRLILPRAKDWKADRKSVRHVGGLSVERLRTIRDLYQLLKAYRMRPEPEDLRQNVPGLGDESLAKFGRRILDQLERLREQRVKQLASRIIEGALGAGRTRSGGGLDRKRPTTRTDPPCHAVVVENLENYRPEESRLRRENRQLMEWAARNARKYIVEGCELHGLLFAEVSPRYTSLQDSRTGAPGIRCEDASVDLIQRAAQLVGDRAGAAKDSDSRQPQTRTDRDTGRWASVLRQVQPESAADRMPNARERVLAGVVQAIPNKPLYGRLVRLPRRGGDLFVSAANNSPTASGLQADLNAAANIGLKALTDPDWWGAWWFVLVETETGQPLQEKVQGCLLWSSEDVILMTDSGPRRPKGRKARAKTRVYAWNPRFWTSGMGNKWTDSKAYWESVERRVCERLLHDQTLPENPF